MKTVVLDFETYYDDTYSLKRMTPIEYVLDPRFECIGCAVNMGGVGAWFEGRQLEQVLEKLPTQVAVISHNALFDMTVLAQKFGYVPTLMIDTLGMARAWWNGTFKGYSIGVLADELGLGQKGTTIHNVKGMGLAALKASPRLYQEFIDYALNDAQLAYALYLRAMGQGFPPSELLVQDTVLRCGIEPRFVLDRNILAQHLFEVRNAKQALLQRVGMTERDDLLSNDRFAEVLKTYGVDPPRKVSLVTGKATWAFAKTDAEFIALEEHEDPDVQALVAARMGIKSTQEETRTERFINISNLMWADGQTAKMPIPLRYGAAHTHRLGGEWSINLQNLKRGSQLRHALKAPTGHKVVKADSTQVEARGVAWLANQTDLIAAFAASEDVYSSFAARIFGYGVNKKDRPVERFIGKTAVLGLGYGLGKEKFAATIKTRSKLELGAAIDMDLTQAGRIVGMYRSVYSGVPALWHTLGGMIQLMTSPTCNVKFGPCTIEFEKVRLPNGLFLCYHDLQFTSDEWTYRHGRMRKRLYGGKFLENITQALARIVVMDAAARIRHRMQAVDPSIKLALQAHDELVYIAPDWAAPQVETILLEEMRRGSSWSQGWPLDAESAIAQSYGG
jgi:DNA polymerase